MQANLSNPLVVMYFRRDLRLEDNQALLRAMQLDLPILPIFIFDDTILSDLPKEDGRVEFIHQTLFTIHQRLNAQGSALLIRKGNPVEVWKEVFQTFNIKAIFATEDYEPYAIKRDSQLSELFKSHQIDFHLVKDQVIFHKREVLKDDGTPYTIFTPYKKKWLLRLQQESWRPASYDIGRIHFLQHSITFPSLKDIGFSPSKLCVLPFDLTKAKDYGQNRNLPAMSHSSLLGPHLRFGTVSVRHVLNHVIDTDETFVAQLIWREFFMQILFHFPHVVHACFHRKYDRIEWKNDVNMFQRWTQGTTGFPLVDAGMRQLNETGYMHNRVRMVVASFLTKDLLIDWRWGEQYFAEKLLDFELASNNTSWQWVAGTGCDAAPYFRIFNPHEQARKFDPEGAYIRSWIKDIDSIHYPPPMIDHREACSRTIETYKKCNE